MPVRLVTCCLLLMGIAASFSRAAETFSKVPVWGGEISAAEMCVSDPDVIYATSWYAGLFVTKDAAATWAEISNEGANAVAVHPSLPNVVISAAFGTIDGSHIMRSEDYGQTWAEVGRSAIYDAKVNAVRIVPSTKNEGTFYLLGHDLNTLDGVLYKSADAGVTWTKTSFTSGNKLIADVCVDRDENLFVTAANATPSTNGPPPWDNEMSGWLFKSSDGATWTTLKSFEAAPRYLSVSSATLAVVTMTYGDDSGIYISSNAGHSFTCINSAGNGYGRQAISPDGTKIYSFAPDGLRVISSSSPETGQWNSPTLVSSGSYMSGGYVLINRLDPSIMYAVGNNSVGGGNDDGILKSTDTALSWRPANSGLAGLIAYTGAKDPDGNMYVVGAMSVYKGSSDGTTWNKVFSPDLGQPYDPSNKQHKFESGSVMAAPATDNVFVGTAGDLWRSTDGGQSWTLVFSSTVYSGYANNVDFSALVFNSNNPATGYFALRQSNYGTTAVSWTRLFKTTDGGATWTQVSLNGETIQSLAIDPADPTVIYAGTGDAPIYSSSFIYGGLWKIIDNGSTGSWSKLSLDNKIPYRVVISSNGVMMAACIEPNNTSTDNSHGPAYYSTDGGLTWASISAESDLIGIVDLKFSNGAWYVTDSMTIYASGSPQRPFFQVASKDDLGTIRCLIVGSMYSGANKGLFKLSWSPSTPLTSVIEQPKAYCYPNPFNAATGSTILKYFVPQGRSVDSLKISVYTMSGELVDELPEDNNLDDGNAYYYFWNGKNDSGRLCARGVYIIVFKSNLETVRTKVVLTK